MIKRFGFKLGLAALATLFAASANAQLPAEPGGAPPAAQPNTQPANPPAEQPPESPPGQSDQPMEQPESAQPADQASTGGGWGMDEESIGETDTEDEDKGGFLGAGIRFNWDNYKTPIMESGMAYQDSGDKPVRLSTLNYGTPHFAGVFNWGITNQIVLNASIDFGLFVQKVAPLYLEEGEDDPADTNEVKVKFIQFGILLGAKYIFVEPKAGGVSLYLALNVGKYFAKSTSEGYADDDDHTVEAQADMIGKLASPLVIQAALGAEFFATDNFSIGADILGIRFAFAKADIGGVGTSGDPNADQVSWTGEQSYVNLHLYSALTMNFNLTAGRVSNGDDDDDDSDDEEESGFETPPEDNSNAGWTPNEKEDAGWGSAGGDASANGGTAKPAKKSKPTKKQKKKRRAGKRKKSGGAGPPPPAGP